MRRAVLGLALLMLVPASAGATPVIKPALFGTAGDAGWYRSNVTVNWAVSDDEGKAITDEQNWARDAHSGHHRADHHLHRHEQRRGEAERAGRSAHRQDAPVPSLRPTLTAASTWRDGSTTPSP